MYRCPHCKELSISVRSQLSPPFDGHTKCPNCGTEVKIKDKPSKYLLVLFLLAIALLDSFDVVELDIVTILIFITIIATIQIKLTEYEVATRG